MEKVGQVYYSTTTQSIADLKIQLQRHLGETMLLNTSLQEQLDADTTAFETFDLPCHGRA